MSFVISGQFAKSLARAGPNTCKKGYRLLSVLSSTQLSNLNDWSETVKKPSSALHITDDLSYSKLSDLFCTLPTRDVDPYDFQKTFGQLEDANSKLELPPLHTLAYFYPRTPETHLGADQTDRAFCPPEPFTRRMWAGGSFRFAPDAGLRVGAPATAHFKVAQVEKKGFETEQSDVNKKGSPMVFVYQKIEYEQNQRIALDEERIHVYLPQEARANLRSVREVSGLPNPDYTFSWVPTATTLFRFSAITWNGHLIHLDPEFSQKVEGYPERLVHGPLTALMLVEALYHSNKDIAKRKISKYTYRARNPTVVGQLQNVRGAFTSPNRAIVWSDNGNGSVGMTGEVEFY